jgi:hypothetical protein
VLHIGRFFSQTHLVSLLRTKDDEDVGVFCKEVKRNEWPLPSGLHYNLENL